MKHGGQIEMDNNIQQTYEVPKEYIENKGKRV